ncbi:hypothetical protein SHKM778_80810 [Streptomyces sp. KM77-8]|uniref:beta-N-acetylhexosaminidase n=1 Tax=Streptomyces haneummycinicus TaxID=3074435 RepID=A0AAT9HWQ3_9ACTN
MPDSSTGSTARPSRRAVLAATAGVTTALASAGTVHAATGPSAHDDRRLRALISRMTLEEKVGQLFVMRVYGHSATEPDQADIDANLEEIGVRTAAELLAKYRVGGIIYFAWAHNTRAPHQIADLSNGIQKASLGLPRGLPVLISTDQEHGIVARVGEPATLFPGAMAVGAGGSRADARTLGRVAGRELRALGIRQNYSPVADVNVNPANPVIGVRSFGSDPGPSHGSSRPRSTATSRPVSPRPPSTSRDTATPTPTATPNCPTSTTPASSGASWTRRRSGRRSTPVSTPS